MSVLLNKRIMIVSNRLPYKSIEIGKDIIYKKSDGGLVSSLSSIISSKENIWIGWEERNKKKNNRSVNYYIPEEDIPFTCKIKTIKLMEREISNYYYGFSNRTIWPLFHYFLGKAIFNEDYWNSYIKVNKKFCNGVIEEFIDYNIIWVHDYHLMLLPKMIRDKISSNNIGFFLHIPFPSYDLFGVLPWGRDIIEGILGAYLIGFHTDSYASNFLDSVANMGIAEVDKDKGLINYKNRLIKVRSFPISVDFERFNNLSMAESISLKTKRIRRSLKDNILILGVDRLDYTKGIKERLLAIERFFEKYHKFKKRVVFIQIAVPSRTKVEEYRSMRREIDEIVGRINGRFSETGWTPINYLYRSIPLEDLVAYYKAADIALISPLRDGMNLIAKEYAASKFDNTGVLILSIFAGASKELKEAILVNPFNIEEVADKIYEAITLPNDEKIERMKSLRAKIKKNNISYWVKSFLKELIT
jgi:alpha,alpha-trehalose-phosphate synthase [UDP-forming]